MMWQYRDTLIRYLVEDETLLTVPSGSSSPPVIYYTGSGDATKKFTIYYRPLISVQTYYANGEYGNPIKQLPAPIIDSSGYTIPLYNGLVSATNVLEFGTNTGVRVNSDTSTATCIVTYYPSVNTTTLGADNITTLYCRAYINYEFGGTLSLQLTDDGINWTTYGTPTNTSVAGFAYTTYTGISRTFKQMRLIATGSGDPATGTFSRFQFCQSNAWGQASEKCPEYHVEHMTLTKGINVHYNGYTNIDAVRPNWTDVGINGALYSTYLHTTDNKPYVGSFNIFPRPYLKDSNDAKPALYFGYGSNEGTDDLEFRVATGTNHVEYRVIRVPLVITVADKNPYFAAMRRDMLVHNVKQSLMRTRRLNGYWWDLRMPGRGVGGGGENERTWVTSTGQNDQGITEACALIPISLHYQFSTNSINF